MVEGEFAVGSALGRGFGIWLKNLPSFLLLTAFAFTPLVAYTAYALGGDLDVEGMTTMALVSMFLSAGLSLIVTGALLYGVIKQLRGEHASIGECIGVGLKRMFPILGVGIVSMLPFVLVGLLVVVAPALILLLIIPMIIYFVMIYVAVPASVIERPGIMGAIKRSAQLTSGYKMQIFGIILILGVINWVVNYILQKNFMTDAGMYKTLEDFKTYTWISIGIQVVTTSLQATISGVVYHDLRIAKEGVATEDLAKVFE